MKRLILFTLALIFLLLAQVSATHYYPQYYSHPHYSNGYRYYYPSGEYIRTIGFTYDYYDPFYNYGRSYGKDVLVRSYGHTPSHYPYTNIYYPDRNNFYRPYYHPYFYW